MLRLHMLSQQDFQMSIPMLQRVRILFQSFSVHQLFQALKNKNIHQLQKIQNYTSFHRLKNHMKKYMCHYFRKYQLKNILGYHILEPQNLNEVLNHIRLMKVGIYFFSSPILSSDYLQHLDQQLEGIFHILLLHWDLFRNIRHLRLVVQIKSHLLLLSSIIFNYRQVLHSHSGLEEHIQVHIDTLSNPMAEEYLSRMLLQSNPKSEQPLVFDFKLEKLSRLEPTKFRFGFFSFDLINYKAAFI